MNPLTSVRVRVPASTSNLGPAFDCLGLALGLYNELTLELWPGKGEPAVEIAGEGEGVLPTDKTNLAARAALSVLDRRAKGRLLFKAKNAIPLARGLGSSGAAIVAGLMAGNHLLGKPSLDEAELFQYAAALEGHPDNVAPALFGGLAVCVRQNKDWRTYRLKPHRELRAVVCVPDFKLSTAEARKVLPRTVLREQAVANISRALLLSPALEQGRWEWLGPAMEDELHQPYREPLIKGLREVLSAARRAGACGAALSGAGPSALALCRAGSDLGAVGRAMEEAFRRHGAESRSLELPIDHEGASILE